MRVEQKKILSNQRLRFLHSEMFFNLYSLRHMQVCHTQRLRKRFYKHKPTNGGNNCSRKTEEKICSLDKFFFMGAKISTKLGYESRPPEFDCVTWPNALNTRLVVFFLTFYQSHYLNHKLFFRVKAIERTQN